MSIASHILRIFEEIDIPSNDQQNLANKIYLQNSGQINLLLYRGYKCPRISIELDSEVQKELSNILKYEISTKEFLEAIGYTVDSNGDTLILEPREATDSVDF